MSKKKYPRIHSTSKGTKGKRCMVHSDVLATVRIDVATNFMRGDDAVVYVCDSCKHLGPTELVKIFNDKTRH